MTIVLKSFNIYSYKGKLFIMVILKKVFILGYWLIICCICYLFFGNNSQWMIYMSMLTTIIIVYINFKLDKKRFTYTTVLLLYTIVTQFGLVIPYALFGKNVLSEYSDWTLKFLSSPYLAKSVFLGNIAVIVFTLAKGIAMLKPQQTKNNYSIYKWTNSVDSKRMYIAGISLLTLVFFYFVFNILTGGTALVGTYEMYMKSSAYNNSIYAYILILFYVGTIYIASAGKIMEHKFGWFIWLIIAVFLAVNGNKGEFMYSLLAVIGMKGIEGKKISFKLFLIIGIILFILIPSITFLRDIGIAGNLGSAKLKFMDSFLEMGMQTRTSVYTLEDLAANRISTLHGASYYRPILNFIPFLKGPVATLELKNTYLGYGYNQVIESYWNFGIIGPIVFYGILGYILSRIENKVMDREKLAFIGTVICILINATRNYWAFVPGQLIIVTIIYVVVRKTKIIKHTQ